MVHLSIGELGWYVTTKGTRFEFHWLLCEELLLPWDVLIAELISESSNWLEYCSMNFNALIHLLFLIFLKMASSFQHLSMTMTDKSAKVWPLLVKWVATGDLSMRLWAMLKRWLWISDHWTTVPTCTDPNQATSSVLEVYDQVFAIWTHRGGGFFSMLEHVLVGNWTTTTWHLHLQLIGWHRKSHF